MKTRLLLTVILIHSICQVTSAQWYPVNPDTTSDFTGIFFTSDRKGYVTGCDPFAFGPSNILYTTNDGGASWQSSLTAQLCLPSICFPDSNTGYYLTGGDTPCVNKTTDGGLTWIRIHEGIPGDHIFFTGENIGYASGANIMAKTTDGGANWSWQGLGGPSILDAIYYVNKDTGYVGGWYNGVISKTTDGGNTWTHLSFDYGVHALFFPSPEVGYAAAEDLANNNPVIVKTTNGGATWTVTYRIPTAAPLFFHSLYCINDNTCYTAGDHGTLLKTTDGGATWIQEPIGATQRINSVFCPNGHTCYIAGDSGLVMKTVNTGVDKVTYPETEEIQVTFVPNPAHEQTMLAVDGQLPKHAALTLFDVTGRRVASFDISQRQTIINTAQLSAGVYMYNISGDGVQLKQGKLVVN